MIKNENQKKCTSTHKRKFLSQTFFFTLNGVALTFLIPLGCVPRLEQPVPSVVIEP